MRRMGRRGGGRGGGGGGGGGGGRDESRRRTKIGHIIHESDLRTILEHSKKEDKVQESIQSSTTL